MIAADQAQRFASHAGDEPEIALRRRVAATEAMERLHQGDRAGALLVLSGSVDSQARISGVGGSAVKAAMNQQIAGWVA